MQIGERMKHYYEKAYNIYMPYRMPVIVRVDGKNFHQFTKNMTRPFDSDFVTNMAAVATYLCKQMQTVQIAYVQSDEISLLLHPYKKLDTDPFFANEIQKISSVSAGLASSYMTTLYKKIAVFDARCFVLPESEVVNYFIWRQQDATRNSINSVGQSKFSKKQLHGKNVEEVQEMLFHQHKINWNDLETHLKRGFCVVKTEEGWRVDWEVPIFTQNRNYIHDLLEVEEE